MHNIGTRIGKEVKIAGNKHGINEIFKTIDFYDFALNNGANVDKITNYLSKMYKMTNKNVHEIAKEAKMALKMRIFQV